METSLRLLILGTGGLAVETAELAGQLPGIVIAGFVQNLFPERRRELLEGLPVYYIEDAKPLLADHAAVCALGSPKRVAFIQAAERLGTRFATLVHPSAVVSPSARLAEGVVVAAGVVISARAALGRHALVSRNASIGHDTTVGDYTFIGPAASIAGACTIDAGVFVGIGAVVSDHLTIGAGSRLNAGAIAVRDVPASAVLVGPRSIAVK